MTSVPDLQDLSETTIEKERFKVSCETASQFPKNIVYHDTYDHILEGYFDRLNQQEDRLFCHESKAKVTVRDFCSGTGLKCFENVTFCDYDDLKDYFNDKSGFGKIDPPCRFIFITAPHSRERLNTTREMLVYAFSYHQIIPSFLDFLFPFGRQQYAQDFHFSGFRQEGRISANERGLNIPELGRSGRDVRICYSLKSVEPSKGQVNWPWSVRQASAYQSFDLETGRVLWAVVKGNQLLQQRMKQASNTTLASKVNSYDSLTESFSSCLATHLIMFDWCREHWRWYINYLEEALEKKTRETLLVGFEKPPVPKPVPASTKPQRILSIDTCTSPTIMSEKNIFKPGSSSTIGPQRAPTPSVSESSDSSDDESDGDSDDENEKCFSFKDLQRIQFLEDKANEVLLVLDANCSILLEIQQYFAGVVSSPDWPEELKSRSARGISALARFNRTTSAVISDLRLQRARSQMVLRVLSDRKSLLNGIMDFRNREANKLFAKKAQLSTERMEAMTENMQDLNREMHEIAQKTKQETVSMRIITLVTLFFLPGTFISTIMSTDILQFNTTEKGSQEIFQVEALLRYIEITLPLMFLTFVSWYGVYWWVNRQEKASQEKKVQMKVAA